MEVILLIVTVLGLGICIGTLTVDNEPLPSVLICLFLLPAWAWFTIASQYRGITLIYSGDVRIVDDVAVVVYGKRPLNLNTMTGNNFEDNEAIRIYEAESSKFGWFFVGSDITVKRYQ